MTSPALASYAYTLDAQGNRIQETDSDNSKTSWTYDNNYHLLSESRQSGTANIPATLRPAPPILIAPTKPSVIPPTQPSGNQSGGSVPGGNQIGGSDVHPVLPLPQSQLEAVMFGAQSASTATPSQSGAGSSPLSNGITSWNNVYTYDAVGNRKSMTNVTTGVSTTYSYNGLNQLTQASSSLSTSNYTHNGRGDLTCQSSQIGCSGTISATYQWDARGRLTQLQSGGNSATFTYDAAGHRARSTVNGSAVNYLWDTSSAYGDVIQETNGSNVVLASYTLGNGELLTQQRGATTSYYLHDGQGSVRTLLDTNHNITDSYLYDAYGNTQNHTGTTTNPYQYDGQQLSDSFSGLYDLRARYYDPSVGRFLSQDPYNGNLNDPMQIDRYGYAGGNPVNVVDPSGNGFIDLGFKIADSINESAGLARFIAGGVIGGFASAIGYGLGFAIGIYAADSIIDYSCQTIDTYYSQRIAECYQNKEADIARYNNNQNSSLIPGLLMSLLNGFIVGGIYATFNFQIFAANHLWTRFLSLVSSHPIWMGEGENIINGVSRTLAGGVGAAVGIATLTAYRSIIAGHLALLSLPDALSPIASGLVGGYTSPFSPATVANILFTGLINGFLTTATVAFSN